MHYPGVSGGSTRDACQLQAMSAVNVLQDGKSRMDRPSWVPDWLNPSDSEEWPHPFQKASGLTFSDLNYLGDGVLRVTGVIPTEIAGIQTIPVLKTYTDIAQVVVSLIAKNTSEGQDIRDCEILDAYCRTLCANCFSGCLVPIYPGFPSFNEGSQTLHDLLDSKLNMPIFTPVNEKYLGCVGTTLRGRTFFTTADGRIGVSARETQPGDQVCVILGCSLPLILRSTERGQYQIVGNCYVHGIMDGEALLGPLPAGFEGIFQIDSNTGDEHRAHIDRTGEIHVVDPRLGPLPENWRLESHESERFYSRFVNDKTGEDFDRRAVDPRLTPQALKDRGVYLIDIELV